MNDQQYRAAIDAVKEEFAAIAANKSVGVVVPAAMEIVLCAMTSIDDKEMALQGVQSLRPMIDHIEGQLRGSH